MKTRLLFLPFLVLLAGCSTIDRRIEEKAAVFASLDPATQEQLRQGMVEVGYDTDMVYIALGRPDERRERVTAAGREQVWIYSTYFQEYVGTTTMGYRRYVTVHPRTGERIIYFEPIRTDIYRDRVDERIRITFINGRVTVIEQVQR
ncbi:MAG TPA: hypothetical protein PKY38_06560 [Opitutaceae bacterium]|nr:hypothetical protein [Opitutaceae bacterium]